MVEDELSEEETDNIQATEEENDGEIKEDLTIQGGASPSEGRGGSRIAIVLISLMLVVAGGIAGVVLLGKNLDDGPDEMDDTEPEIDIISEDVGYDGIPFSFVAGVTGMDPGDMVISWDFGDGQTNAGTNVEHIFEETGIFTVTLTIEDDGEVVLQTTKLVTVAPASGPAEGLLPDGRIPDWNIEFTGDCGEGTLALLDIVTNPDMIMEINITLNGQERSFVGVELMEVFNLAGIRFDADDFTVIGDSTYASDVFTTLSLPFNGGNSTYLILTENDRWLSNTDLNSTYMLIGPGGEVVTNVHTVDIDPFHLVITGQGIPEDISLTIDRIHELFELTDYNVSDGREMYRFSGYPLWPILEYASILRNATEVSFKALDGYTVDFPVNYIHDNPESDDPFFLSISEDGVFHDRLKGPYMLVTPDADYLDNPAQPWYKQFWVKQVSSIIVDADDGPAPDLPWGEPEEAALNITWDGGSYSFTSSELASYFDLLVTAECTKVKRTGTTITDVYTGIPVFDLLELAGAPAVYGGLTFISSDGYAKTADPWEIYQGELAGNVTMVALTEGGEWISEEDGGLMIAGSPLASKYWVSMLSEIHLEEWSLEVNDEAITLGDLKYSGYTYSGNASKLRDDNTTTNVTAKGTIVYDLLGSYLNLTGMNNMTFFSVDGSNITISLDDLKDRKAWNVSAFLAWEVDGETLYYHSGLLRLVLPDEMIDGDDWTADMWLSGVYRIEVTP